MTKASAYRMVALLGIVICVIHFAKNGIEWRPRAEDECPINLPLAEDLWYHSSEQIITVGREGSRITVGRWAHKDCREVSKARFDFATAVRSTGKSLAPRYSLRAAFLDEGPRPRTWFPYSISADGTKLSWFLEGRVFIKDLDAVDGLQFFKPDRTGRTTASVVALSFSSGDVISLLFEDGEMAHWNYVSRRQWDFKAPLTREWVIWTSGPRLLTSLLGQKTIALLDLKGDGDTRNEIINKWVLAGTSALALAPSGGVVAGTLDGTIMTYGLKEKKVPFTQRIERSFHFDRMIRLPEARAVRAVAFRPDGLIFAGGEFANIYAIGSDSKPQKVLEVRSQARIIAANSASLAVSDLREIWVAKVDQHLAMNEFGERRLMVYSFLISLLSLALAAVSLPMFRPKSASGQSGQV